MKKYLTIKQVSIFTALLLTLSLLLTGCGKTGAESEEAETKTATLWAGTTQSDLISEPMEYTGELTAEKLAKGLSEWTGLDFFVTDSDAPDGISVDWAENSTLIAGLDDRAQKDDFHFYDAESLRWFMMDSLLYTLNTNLSPENVYYTRNEGQALTFDELSPVSEFPTDLPYMGSVFYFSHEGGRGDLIDENGDVTNSESDPDDTGQPEWWGTYQNDELGFSRYHQPNTAKQAFGLKSACWEKGTLFWAAQVDVNPEHNLYATFGDFRINFSLTEDFRAVEIMGYEDSEWAHLFGTYTKLE